MTVTIGVLALQGDVREHLRALEDCGARTRAVRRPADLDEIDGIVIPGGESTTIDKLLRAFDIFDPLQSAIGAGLPAYGSCAGMILLADKVLDGIEGQKSLGGLPIQVRRNAFGRQINSFESELELQEITDGEDPFLAIFIRAPWVEEVAPEVAVLGRVAAGPNAGRIVAVRHGAIMATSFHPEMTADVRVHRRFATIVEENS